ERYDAAFGYALLAVSSVGVFSLVAVAAAAPLGAIEMERPRAEQRVGVAYAVARVLAGSETLAEATPGILEVACASVGWDVGAIWEVAFPEDRLRCVAVTRAPGVAAPEFEAVTLRQTFARGKGLPGRVWESGRPTWIV